MSAVWVKAAFAMQNLAEMAGKKPFCSKAAQVYEKAKKAFEENFWDESSQVYAYAFNSKGDHVKEICPWNAVALMWEMGTEKHSLSSLEKLCSSELTTDWGIRSISIKSKYFQPLNYNYGAVWPFLTSWVTTALFKHHMPLQGFNLLKATARHTYDHALGCITEVFSGTHNVWPQEAVSQQGFSTAGVTLPLIRGLCGLEGNAVDKSISFAPHFPADWKKVIIENYITGQASFSFTYERGKTYIKVRINTENAEGYTIHFAPAVGIGSPIQSVAVDGKPIDFKIKSSVQVTQPEINIPVKDVSLETNIELSPTLEILPFIPEPRVGDQNRGLKIISVRRKEAQMELSVEGLAGESYELKVMNGEKIEGIEGAVYRDGKIQIRMPEREPGSFVPHRIVIRLRDRKAQSAILNR
jgi:hypothetical protein